MNELITAMSSDMGINPYEGETDDSFIYRLCYSSLGLWCLHLAKNSLSGREGTTKHNQTIVINELLHRYAELFPEISDRFMLSNNPLAKFSVHIRRVYEETGYLLTDKSNRNYLANYGRDVLVGNTSLFIGIPSKLYTVNGLGVFTSPTTSSISSREFLIRDGLTYEEFFQDRYDIIEFYEKDIGIDELQFFNPLLANVPSRSWSADMVTQCSIARMSELGPFYRVIHESDQSLLFADEIVEQNSDSFTSCEYRRLYYAIKAYYNNPLKAWIYKLDKQYSKLRIGGYLPNREYFYLLLISWPTQNAFDKVNFIIRNDFIPEVSNVLKNIGIEIIGGIADE